MRVSRFLPLAALLVPLLVWQGGPAVAQGPFTPTFSVTLDEVAPNNPDVLPADDECPVGAACKLLWWAEIPDGQPLAGISGIVPSSIIGIASDALVPDGAIVGKVVGSWRVGPVGRCAVEGTVFAFQATALGASSRQRRAQAQ
jgi:hypothetical protein